MGTTLTPLGFVVPDADDPVANGENRIATNALLSEQFLAMGLVHKGNLTLGLDMNTLSTPGIYSIPTTPIAESLLNIGSPVRGPVIVLGEPGGSRTQLHFPTTGGMLTRSINSATGTWPTNWLQADPIGRQLPDGTNLNEFRSPGSWYVLSSVNAATMTNLPAITSGVLVNLTAAGATNSGAAHIQVFYGTSTAPGVWYRVVTGGTVGSYTWSDWQALHWTRDYGAGHQVNVQRELMSMGGRIGTGGKPVVAIRIDHNNTNFQTIMLPLLRDRGLPASMCHFVNEFTPDPGYTNDTSTGYGWTDVQNAALRDGIEVFSHGWSHQEVSTQAGYEKEILDSRAYLEAQMPLIRVKGFMVPGVTGNNWGNFSNNLSNLDVFRTTEAGRLIMHNYASCNGGGSQLQPLNGGVTLGWQSRQIDTDTVSSTQINIIKSAQVSKQGCIIMIHPNQIDKGAGYITTTVLTEILDFLVTERDAGRLEVLTITGLLHADTDGTSRHNALRDPAFTAPTTYYTGTTNYTFAAGVASGNASSGLLAQNVSMTSQGFIQGSTRMVQATFKATAGATVRLRAYDLANPSNFDVSKDFVLPASANFVTLRRAISVPTSGIANLQLQMGRVSGGAIELKDPGLFAT